MTILLQGMALRQVATQAAVSGLTIREQILRNIQTTLQAVKGVQQPIGNPANASHGVAAAAGGTYLGTEGRLYRATCVLAGASGVARVTAADITSGLSGAPDDGPVASAVTSGTSLSLGSLGITFTVTFAGSLVLGDYWDVYAGTYQSSIVRVTRQTDERVSGGAVGIFGRILEPSEDAADEPVGYTTKHMIVTINVRLNRVPNPESILEQVLGDCENALMVDHTRGGLAIDTQVVTNAAFAMDEVKSGSEFNLIIDVLYRHHRSNTRTQ